MASVEARDWDNAEEEDFTEDSDEDEYDATDEEPDCRVCSWARVCGRSKEELDPDSLDGARADSSIRIGEHSRVHWFWKYQVPVHDFYVRMEVQVFVAGLITANFLVQCLQREMVPDYEKRIEAGETDPTLEFFSRSTKVFTVVFLVELLINMYGSWWTPFIEKGWNRFDVIVVTLGVLDLVGLTPAGPLRMVRMLRAFRIFRLFGRVDALRKILESLTNAAGDVFKTLTILLVVMCLFSVVAVDAFSTLYCDCTEDCEPIGQTARELCWGEDYYGTFSRSMWTMFQILTGESWSEAAVRPAMHYFYTEHMFLAYFGTIIFFITFVYFNSIVMLNLFVASLLDGMNKTAPLEESDKRTGLVTEEQVKAFRRAALDRLKELDDHVEKVAQKMNL